MKKIALLAAFLFASLSAHAQLRGVAEDSTMKGDERRPIHVDCGTAFAHGDSTEFHSLSGHSIAFTIDRNAKQVVLVRDGEQWVGRLDAKGALHVIDPKGTESVRAPMAPAEAALLARTTRDRFIALTSPCEKSVAAPKCLDMVQSSAPSTSEPGPFSPATPAPSQTKCIPDYEGDPMWWGDLLFTEDFSGVLSFSFDVSQGLQQCLQQKSACNQVCGDGLALAGVACSAAAVANPVLGVACAAGAVVAYQSCEGHCSSAFPC